MSRYGEAVDDGRPRSESRQPGIQVTCHFGFNGEMTYVISTLNRGHHHRRWIRWRHGTWRAQHAPEHRVDMLEGVIALLDDLRRDQALF